MNVADIMQQNQLQKLETEIILKKSAVTLNSNAMSLNLTS